MSMSVKIITLYTLIVIVQFYFSSEVQSNAQILRKEYFIIIASITIMYLSVARQPYTTEISETAGAQFRFAFMR